MKENSRYSFLSFATGNIEKFNEAHELLPGLRHITIDLPEIQELDTKKIVKAKLEAVAQRGLREVMVEDVALHFDALGGLPGPLIKWFLKARTPRELFELADRSGNCGARAVAVIGYLNAAGESIFAQGEVLGTLVAPRGGDGFGWDPIFNPQGSSKTYAELTTQEKSAVSHRSLAIRDLKRQVAWQAP